MRYNPIKRVLGDENSGVGAEGMAKDADEAPIIKLLDQILIRGYREGASDIHLEPREDSLVVRMRVDGRLAEMERIDKDKHAKIVTRSKIMCGMDIAEKRLPQDGHCNTIIEDVEINLRASSVPTIHGEKMVFRFLNMKVKVDRAEMFGMREENYRKVLEILKRSGGVLYLTGPTGSGKTTTLYMILEWLKENPINIMTVEDPVERNIEGINQIQVNEQAGLTFEKGLRAILRQDPDVIMVGETRDNVTARTSVRAAITGNLVLSTLHTNDAVGAIVRMMDMDVEPYLVSNSLSGVVAQRLVRKVCTCCAEEVPVTEDEASRLGLKIKMVRRGKGCELCNHTGYKGRIAIHEVMSVDKNMRKMIADRRPAEEIYEYVDTVQNMQTLRDDMVYLVEQGITSVEELVRVVDGDLV